MKLMEAKLFYPDVILIDNKGQYNGGLKGLGVTTDVEGQTKDIMAGLNKTVGVSLLVAGAVWYFFLRK